nr:MULTISPECIES: oxidoreductase [unclassified Corynebacterium]
MTPPHRLRAPLGNRRVCELESANVFNLFGRNKNTSTRPPRAPEETIRPKDLTYLQQWAGTRKGVEGFVEPETIVNEMSVVLVDSEGEWTRRRIGGPKGIDKVAQSVGIPLYFAEETGYPQRMRDRIERDRLIKKRLEQRERRAQFEQRRAEKGD